MAVLPVDCRLSDKHDDFHTERAVSVLGRAYIHDTEARLERIRRVRLIVRGDLSMRIEVLRSGVKELNTRW